MIKSSLPELLAPAGDWDCARAAVENGADAIYFGVDRFNARMRANNFTIADLPELMAFLHGRGVKGYLTLNTLMFTEELGELEAVLRAVISAGVDAAIVQDVGVCSLIRHLSPDFPIHASTQMSISSAAGVDFAQRLGCQLVVLARECSLKDLEVIQTQTQRSLPLEVFVHGALCVAYSGQCLTSEALGGRSANRGECAQACRMTYDLVVNGEVQDLGDRHYLLSPQDLAGLPVLPELVQTGVASLKIEGRLKTPEYVASVTRIYRQQLDALLEDTPPTVLPEHQYQLEMAFSRGLYTGWFEGVNNQALVHAQFAKKRGVYLGEVVAIEPQRILLERSAAALDYPLKAGDGVVFERGDREQQKEVGGRIYQVQHRGDRECWLSFSRKHFDLGAVQWGDRVWKTNDPELDQQIRRTYQGEQPQHARPLWFQVQGSEGEPLTVTVTDQTGVFVTVTSTLALSAARNQPLTTDRLREQLGRLGNTPFYLADLTNELDGEVILPVRELNQLRRSAIEELQHRRSQSQVWILKPAASYHDLLPQQQNAVQGELDRGTEAFASPLLPIPLVRTLGQLEAVLDLKPPLVYCELEDPRKYTEAVAIVRQHSTTQLFVAPPRITKPNEQWILEQVRRCDADGYLVRNYDHLNFFQSDRCVADFSYNIANPLTATYFKAQFPQLERLTASYDLNGQQLEALATHLPPDWLEVTLHQHMPLFHMEHCVFCAFLSEGTDYTNCGRPCEQYRVKLRDRVGVEHILQADAGCRNTVFNGTAQSGAEWLPRFQSLGLRHFRIEFLQESPQQVQTILQQYDRLLRGELSGADLWKTLRNTTGSLQQQLGVTRGTLK
ncbi:MAG: DUF3656 domain-containing U32 family peptidase [Prochlorotrichaceae cyanobacterium]